MKRVGLDSLQLLDLIKVKDKHYLHREIKSMYGTDVGLVVSVSQIENGMSILSVLFGNGIYKVIAGYNDCSNERPAWCDVIFEGS